MLSVPDRPPGEGGGTHAFSTLSSRSRLRRGRGADQTHEECPAPAVKAHVSVPADMVCVEEKGNSIHCRPAGRPGTQDWKPVPDKQTVDLAGYRGIRQHDRLAVCEKVRAIHLEARFTDRIRSVEPVGAPERRRPEDRLRSLKNDVNSLVHQWAQKSHSLFDGRAAQLRRFSIRHGFSVELVGKIRPLVPETGQPEGWQEQDVAATRLAQYLRRDATREFLPPRRGIASRAKQAEVRTAL